MSVDCNVLINSLQRVADVNEFAIQLTFSIAVLVFLCWVVYHVFEVFPGGAN